MGITYQRDTTREMYLHLLLLISPAFGMPTSALIETGEEFIKQFDSIPDFTEETRAMFKNITRELYEKVSESLLEAEKNIIELNVELKLLETKKPFKEDYFLAFNEAKRYLRESRQQVRKLADRTVKEVRALKLLLIDLDKSEDTVLLKISLDKMKDLMIETLKTLKESLGKYNSARETIQNISSSIKKQNVILEKMLDESTAEYKAWTTDLRVAINGTIGETPTGCKIANYFGALRICSSISDAFSGIFASTTEDAVTEAAAKLAALTEARIVEYTKMLEKSKTNTEKMMKSGDDFDKTIEDAIGILTNEIEKIESWTNSADFVNIDEYPKEYLTKYISIRTTFVNGLDDLKNSADEFLALPL